MKPAPQATYAAGIIDFSTLYPDIPAQRPFAPKMALNAVPRNATIDVRL